METPKRSHTIKKLVKNTISLPVYDPDKCALFALGRNAMYSACKSMGLKTGDVVLTPALDCDSTLTPFRVLGLSLEFYRSDPYTYEIDIEDIKSRITKKVKLLHVINHFGMPQPWDSLLALRAETGIPILEDNAFSLFSEFNARPFGTFGDFSFFSLNKMLPVIDGGMLRVNNPVHSMEVPPRSEKWFYPTEKQKLLGMIATKLGYDYLPDVIKKKIRPVKKPLPPLYSDKPGYPDWHLRDAILRSFSCDYYRPMSKIAQIQMKTFLTNDLDIVRKKIRHYYKFIVEELRSVRGIQLLWPEISESIVPNCVSILVNTRRDDILYRLKSKKLGAIAWPTFSGDVIDRTREYPEIEIIGKKILQLKLPAVRVIKKDADSYFKNLVNEVIECSNRYQSE